VKDAGKALAVSRAITTRRKVVIGGRACRGRAPQARPVSFGALLVRCGHEGRGVALADGGVVALGK